MVFWLILIFSVVYVLFGALWYFIFRGVGHKEIHQEPGRLFLSYVLSFLNRILTLAALAFLIELGQIRSFWGGFILGLVLVIGFIAPTLFSQVIWRVMTFTKCLVHICFNLIAISVIGGLFAIWG